LLDEKMPPPTKRARSGEEKGDVAMAEDVAHEKAATFAQGGSSASLLGMSAQALATAIELNPAGHADAHQEAQTPLDVLGPVFHKLSYLALLPFAEHPSGYFSEAISFDILRQSMAAQEDKLRSLFARAPPLSGHGTLDQKLTAEESQEIADPHVMLMNPFAHPEAFEYTLGSAEEQAIPRWFRAQAGTADRPQSGSCISKNVNEFKRNWDVFSMGQLGALDWTNVFAAGGAVEACLEPYPEAMLAAGDKKKGKSDDAASAAAPPAKKEQPDLKDLRKHLNGSPNYMPASGSLYGWHRNAGGDAKKAKRETTLSTDIDLFVYGLTGEEATNKLREIENAIVEANPHELLVVRTGQAVTFVSQHPYRHIQVILRCYRSPAEILMGFDLDSVTVGYDGTGVWCLPRFHRAVTRGYNLVSQSRRSTTYESRLMKYAMRGYCVAIPGLDMSRVDSEAVAKKEAKEVKAGARLLWLEQKSLEKAEEYWRYMTPGKAKEDKKAQGWAAAPISYVDVSNEGESLLQRFRFQASWLKPRVAEYEMLSGKGAADYAAVFLPWGPRWNAGRISTWLSDKYCQGTYGADDDASVRKSNRNGDSVEGVLGEMSDADEYDSEDEDEDEGDDGDDEDGASKKKKKTRSADLPDRETDVVHNDVKLPLMWLTHEPGRQFIGSFHPEKGDWFEQLYAIGGDGGDAGGDAVAVDIPAAADADERPPCKFWDGE
jgi:hypothetical protein